MKLIPVQTRFFELLQRKKRQASNVMSFQNHFLERPNSPMKWVVDDDDDDDDDDGPTAPTIDPIDSSVASEIFRVVAERENLGKHCDVIPKPESGSMLYESCYKLDIIAGSGIL
ncbi:hypothetical protein F7725_000199 [Dissostichus mawsoni]|uniref:Uncharacterized protein n=1 Tax=Dissostichus mawsoni TaxID=36200 RepID=A0A7J5ZDP6_DISMA|nr:hypothetical protein F7725_000199 [Dissostichus mawsoni]